MLVENNIISCPYCGERIEIMIDTSIDSQSYIEDCFVCCRPIELAVNVADESINIIVKRDDE